MIRTIAVQCTRAVGSLLCCIRRRKSIAIPSRRTHQTQSLKDARKSYSSQAEIRTLSWLPAGRRRVDRVPGHRKIAGRAHFRQTDPIDARPDPLEVSYGKPSQCLDQLAGPIPDGISVLEDQLSVLVVLLAKAIQRNGRGAEVIELVEQGFNDFEAAVGIVPCVGHRDLEQGIQLTAVLNT